MTAPNDSNTSCKWCGKSFSQSHKGGPDKLYCSEQCRRDLHQAARTWALRQVDLGLLDIPTLRQHDQERRTRRLEG